MHGGELPCPYCAAATTPLLAAPDVNRRVTRTVFHLRQCSVCGLIFVADPPSDLGPYYTSDYHYVPKDRAELERHLPPQRFKIELLRRYRQSGTLLEIGPSIGQFCALAQQAGFVVHAVEMDAECARFLSTELGVATTCSPDPASVLRDQPQTYDAICLWHALEHLQRPWDVLAAATARLNPGGVIVVAAPNPLSIQARRMGGRWPHHDLPRHLFGLPMPWMSRWAEAQGLDVVLATTRDEGSLDWNRFSWAMRVIGLVPGAKPGRLVWWLGMRIGGLMLRFEGGEGEGACYTMVLQRPESPAVAN